jgi:hypothetical protein
VKPTAPPPGRGYFLLSPAKALGLTGQLDAGSMWGMDTIGSNMHITGDGEYIIFTGPPGATAVVEIEGDLDSATVTLGRESIAKVFRPYVVNDVDVELTAGSCEMIVMGARGAIALKVDGGGEAMDIMVAVTRYKASYYQ